MARVSQPLTDRQIAWCREHINSFADAWQAVQKADAHRRKIYKDLGVDPSGLSQGAAE